MTDTSTTPPVSSGPPIFQLSDKAYNFLKFLALVMIPAIASGYFTLAGILNLAHPEQVVGVLTVLDTLLGLLLGVSTKSFKKATQFEGSIVISKDPSGTKFYSLELENNPETLDSKSSVVFKIVNNVSL